MPEGAVHFVLLDGSAELISGRLAARQHEFMNPKLYTGDAVPDAGKAGRMRLRL